jgi:CRISPR system Cascade subunit CasE
MVSVDFHLSRVVLPRADVYAVHQTLWRAFEPLEPKERPFLFRADPLDDGVSGGLVVLVQSEAAPAWDRLKPALSDAKIKRVTLAVDVGSSFRFLLRANPTVARKGRNEPATKELSGEAFRAARGHRVGILRDEERRTWLDRHALAAGFATVGPVSLLRPTSVGWSRKGSGGAAKHDGIDIEGYLRVDDPKRFQAALTAGIGSAKAFGFGLLSLAPA